MVLDFFLSSEGICFLFLLISLTRLSFSVEHFPVSALDDLFFVPWAILIVKFFRERRQWMLTLLALLMVAFYVHAARMLLLPTLFCVMLGLLYQQRRVVLLFSQIREALPMSIMTMLYPFVPMLITAAHMPDQDFNLQRFDEILFFGNSPQMIAQAMIHPWLSEWMALSYSAYAFIILFVFVFLYSKDDLRGFREYVWMSTLCLAVGYTFYSLVPAQGPVFTQQFSVPLDLYYMKYVKDALMDRTRIERDCFPSLHTALSLLSLYSAWRHVRKLFWIMLPLVVSIPFACVYLRYHYVTDVLAGILLAGLIARSALYKF